MKILELDRNQLCDGISNKIYNILKLDVPKHEIDRKVKTGIPPPSPGSFTSSEQPENCTSGVVLVPLR